MGSLCSREIVHINNCKYKVLDRLGEGSFSKVDLVQHEFTKKKFALKTVKCYSEADEKIALKKIENHKKIDHINVMKLIYFDIKVQPDIATNAVSEVHMLMPYFERGTLQHYLDIKKKRKEYCNENEILTMFLGICEGVRAFHEAKPEPLAHHNLKPDKICLRKDMSPVIMDLGSVTEARAKIGGVQDVRQLQELTGARCSLPYKAPELLNVVSYCTVDEKTDIWSLGCILYAMCFLKSPFETIYERGDSVALAKISGHISFPEEGSYDGSIYKLISYILKLNPMERPHIHSVIKKTFQLLVQYEKNCLYIC